MSHFTVLVIGADVDAQLAPYHEFECTGHDDQYVQNFDRLAEAREEYASYSGKGEYPTLAAFITEWYGARPIGPTDTPDLSGPHKYGWLRLDADGEAVEYVDRTNPNKKWDWYQIGGRWTGFFKLRSRIAPHAVGAPGLMTEAARPGYADQAQKGDIDFNGMRAEAAEKAGQQWDGLHAIIAGRPVLAWDDARKLHPGDIDAARKTYHSQPVLADLRRLPVDDDRRWAEVERFMVPRDVFVQRARDAAVQTFAVVKDGQWYERGEMGWFACVSNEKDGDQWNREFAALLDALPDDTLLTVVDCHI